MKNPNINGQTINPSYLRSARHLASRAFQDVLRPGDRAVDATLGTGQDCVQLCRLVGEQGLVYGFDVQQDALNRSRLRLEEEGVEKQARLILAGHETMKQYVQPGVRLVAFNLGWLPGSDKTLTTLRQTTISAVHVALDLLAVNGLLVICCYPGHPEGLAEQEALLALAAQLPPKAYSVLWHQFINGGPGAPGCMMIEKLKEDIP